VAHAGVQTLRFCLAAALTLCGGTAFAAPQPPLATPNPLLHQVAPSNVAVDLVDFVQVPPSDTGRPLARINYLAPVEDGSGRLFVADMRGKIYVIRKGIVQPRPFLDLASIAAPNFFCEDDEHGLVSFAFHPDYARKGLPGFGKFYTIHSERGDLDPNDRTPLFYGPSHTPDHVKIVTEWSVDPVDPDRIDPESRREILRLAPWREDHGGGELAFDPNQRQGDRDYGLLYLSVGDGGNSVGPSGKVDLYHQAQNTGVAFGKILRINPLRAGAQPYSVPATNPFLNRKGFLPEIWAYGLRNPERFSWDRGGARQMLIADIGQANIEEIDLGKAGANYGWSTYEGYFLVDHNDESRLLTIPAGSVPAGLSFPVAAYDHSDGVAITGGYVYRGRLIPALVGNYVFGDIVTGDLFFADAASLESGTRTRVFRLKLFFHGKQTTMRTGVLGNDDRADLRLGIDQDGEIYALTKRDGMIRRLMPHKS